MPIKSSFGAGSASGFGVGACSGPAYIEATGGTESTVGDYKIHVFTGDDTLCVTSKGKSSGSNTADYMVVAGGGGGGGSTGGGGGGGGFRESPGTASGSYTTSPLGAAPAVAIEVTKGAMPITVGAGGSGSLVSGGNSIFGSITSAGGGGGNGQDGGSGAGAGRLGNCNGSGNTPPVNPPQGQDGGTGPNLTGAGGGGATSTPGSSKTGGSGAATNIENTPKTFSGGGGGGADLTQDPGGNGGPGGGGRGGNRQNSPTAGTPGTANTGGGGGARGIPGGADASGGSGLVVVRYKFQN